MSSILLRPRCVKEAVIRVAHSCQTWDNGWVNISRGSWRMIGKAWWSKCASVGGEVNGNVHKAYMRTSAPDAGV